MNSFKDDIRASVANGDLSLVLDRLKTACHATSPRLFDEVVLLESRLNRLLKDSRKGTLTREAFEVGSTRVAESILSILDEIPIADEAHTLIDFTQKATSNKENHTIVSMSNQTILGINNLKQISWIQLGLSVARSVGRILTAGGFGTGFLVGESLLMTNHHVIPNAAVASQSFIEFNYQQDVAGGFLNSVRYALDGTRFFTTGDLLDCSIVGVLEERGKPAISSWGTVILNPNADPVPSEHVIIVQHPNGGYKQIVLTANHVIGIQGNALHYTTDTMPGSSGSPVFNDSWHVIAIHHAGGQLYRSAAGDSRYTNEGILMSGIRAAFGSHWPQ